MQLKSPPSYLKKRIYVTEDLFETKRLLRDFSVDTICESSLCPNLTECFSKRCATFLILGKSCTRSCGYCPMEKGKTQSVDPEEPARISKVIRALRLKYAVITSVSRDDLADCGAGQFVKTIEAVKALSADIKIEILVPDFGGRKAPAESSINAHPDVFSHNIETVKRLYPIVRPHSDYYRSIDLLTRVKIIDQKQISKSAILIGLGEREEEVINTMRDLRRARCDILTIGQYLSPGSGHLPVMRFVAQDEFERYKIIGEEIGFGCVLSGPFVRSSYLAEELYDELKIRNSKLGDRAHD